MGWFSKGESKPDPIGNICRLLVEKPWEWTPGETTDTGDADLTHLSGVGLIYDYCKIFRRPEVSLGAGSVCVPVPHADAARLYAAIQGNAAARAMRPRVEFDAATRAVAKAVLDGDVEAARQLADWVMENCGATTPEGT